MTVPARPVAAALTAAAALALAVTTACAASTTQSKPYQYSELAKRVADAGFFVKPGSGELDDGRIRFTVDLGCSQLSYFTVKDPTATPLQLQTLIVVHPAANMVDFGYAPFTAPPTPEQIRVDGLCASRNPPTYADGTIPNAEQTYQHEGFAVVPGTFGTDGVGSIVDLNLGCPDHQPRSFMNGKVTYGSLQIDVETRVDGKTVTKHYEFIGQPTPQQVVDFELCDPPS